MRLDGLRRRGRGGVVVDAHAREVGRQAAHADLAAFAAVAGDRDAGNALQAFGQVGVREGGDVVGIDGVEFDIGLAFLLQRSLQRGAEAVDDDDRVVGGLGGG